MYKITARHVTSVRMLPFGWQLLHLQIDLYVFAVGRRKLQCAEVFKRLTSFTAHLASAAARSAL